MELSTKTANRDLDRRWAGAFRPCVSCGGRNWVGARRCRRCAASLVGARAVSRPKVAMVGRRAADRVLTPRIRAAALVVLALAIAGGAVLLHLFRADGFEAERAVASSAQPASPPATAAAAASPAEPDANVANALRAADRGRDLLARGEVKAALALLGPAVHARPASAELAHLYGTALWTFGARDRGLFQLQRAVRLSPQTETYREDLARALQAMGRPGAAARLLYGPPMPPAGTDADPTQEGAPPVSLERGADLGGAGEGAYKGRRSFSDEDLRGRVHLPVPRESPR
jgi:hypothetical protein